jgi:hypothetical protein
MSNFPPNRQYNRRKILHLASLAAGASLLPSACRSLDYSGGEISTNAQNTTTPASQASAPPQTSKVVLVYSEDRTEGT